MVKCIVFTALIVAIAFAPSTGHAKWRFQAGGNLTIGFPQEEFKEKVESNGVGFTGYGAVGIPNTPLLFGGSLGGIVYGRETWKERLISTVPVLVDVTTSNKLIWGHLLVRLQPQRGKILPYVDGLFGFANFRTTTSITAEYDFTPIAESTNFDEYTSSYGAGAGVMFKVYSHQPEEIERHKGFNLCVDLGLRYLVGGETQYLKEGSIHVIEDRDDPPRIAITPEESATDIVSGHIGVSFFF